MTNDIDDRLSRRFGDEQNDENDKNSVNSENAQNSTQSKTDMKAQNDMTSQKAQNVKKEWNVRSIYLDDDLDSSLATAFKRLDLEISETGADLNLKKTRHFYPLIVELGLEQLESMEVTEVMERLDE
jgi:hypothetical protein